MAAKPKGRVVQCPAAFSVPVTAGESLFGLTGTYLAAQQRLLEIDLDPQTIADTLESLEGDIAVKSLRVIAIAQQYDAFAKAIMDRMTAMAKRAAGAQSQAEMLRKYVLDSLKAAGFDKGRDGTIRYLFTLPDSDVQSLVWLGDDPHKARPEIRLTELKFDSPNDCWTVKKDTDGQIDLNDKAHIWQHKQSFIGINSSESQDQHYVLEDGSWRRVVGYQRIGEEFVHRDYASNRGTTIRFGEGEFGKTPAEQTIFRVDYRLGSGRQSNVAADSLTQFWGGTPLAPSVKCDPILKKLDFIKTVTNPLPTENGLDAELPNDIRQSAPEAFRAVTYRAVRPEDYAEAAERLPWVQRAGAAFRWTGSWQTAFVTPDPLDRVTLEEPQRQALVEQLDRFRQAGREAYTLDPIYADLARLTTR